jgi:hypothetical protein
VAPGPHANTGTIKKITTPSKNVYLLFIIAFYP